LDGSSGEKAAHSADAGERVLLWLSQNTTSTDREADKVSKETKRYIKALLGWQDRRPTRENFFTGGSFYC